MTTTYTAALKLNKPEFRDPGWGNLVNTNMDVLDDAITSLFAESNFTNWANATAWTQGQIALDIEASPTSYWICNIDHTSAVAPTTFAQDRTANPSYWSAFLFSYKVRGAWTHSTQYLINDIAYDTTLGITGICNTSHVSNAAGTINDDVANWDYIINLPTSLPAAAVPYSNTTSGLAATNTQTAIDEVDADLDAAQATIVTHTSQIATLTSDLAASDVNIATNTADILLAKPEAGDVIFSMRPTAKAGWAVCNDGTIGSSASVATLYANALAFTLYSTLWSGYSDALCPVSGGRGASAVADFAANKTIGITKMLGRALIAAGTGSGLTARPAGTIGGLETHALTAAQIPSLTSTNGSQSISVTSSQANVPSNAVSHGTVEGNTGTLYGILGGAGGTAPVVLSNITSSGNNSVSVTSSGTSGSAHSIMQPFQALYAHIRLY